MPCDENRSPVREVLIAAATALATALAGALVEETREWMKRRREATTAKPTARPS